MGKNIYEKFLSLRSFFRSLLQRFTFVILASIVLNSCGGGGGGSTSTPPTVNYQGSGLQLGVSTDDGTYISVLPGEKISRDVFLSKAAADINTQLSLEAAVNGVQLLQSGGGSSLEIDATALAAGSQFSVTVVAKNLDNGSTERVSLVVNVLSPQVVASGNLTTAASTVTSNDGAVGVQVDAGQLKTPVGVTITTAVTPSGSSEIRISFDRDVSGETGNITLLSNPSLLAATLSKSIQKSVRAGLSSTDYPKFLIKNYGAYFTTGIFVHHRLASSINAIDLIGKTCDGQASQTLSGICLYYDPQAAQLNSMDLSVLKSNTTEIVPVLFINGIDELTDLGGGEGTWNDFPKLVSDLSGNQYTYVPFEFRWRTDAAFSVVADDLADAITEIHNLTGRPVRIIAHSFGGLLTRTLLEGLAKNNKAFDKSYVRSVMTLGTPHSGIFDKVTPTITHTFPVGQFDNLAIRLGFNWCPQISCIQAGVKQIIPLDANMKALTDAGETGALMDSLATSKLPDGLPFVVGIGLATRFLNADTCPGQFDSTGVNAKCYVDGDDLISFNGQRFSPESSEIVAKFPIPSKPLLNCDQTHGGSIKEVILGAFDANGAPDVNARPNYPYSYGLIGYAHAQELIFSLGDKAEPYITCSALTGCTDAAINLFKSLLDQPQQYCENTLAPPPVTTYTLTTNITGTGAGTVVSAPSTASTTGINCSIGTCTALYNSGASVSLIATLATGSSFAGWSGGCSGAGSCTVTMNASVTVTATFSASTPLPVVTLTASPSSIASGATSTLSWSSINSTSCTSPGGGGTGTAGSFITPSLTATTSYTVTCTGAGGTASQNATVTVAAMAPTSTLNDTGITATQCYQAGSDVLVDCGSAGAIALNNAQDGMTGRDANAATNSNTDGKLGFSFTGVPAAGSDPGGCVQDNITGLIWEVKTTDGGLRDWNKAYTNYDSTLSAQKWNYSTYVAPTQTEIDAATNSVGFKNSVNAQGLCGYSDWRLPTADELQSIMDHEFSSPAKNITWNPAIDSTWFPNTHAFPPIAGGFWSASPFVGGTGYAWVVGFGYGGVGDNYRSFSGYVRLVRAGQSAAPPRYTVSADGQEVTDNQTKLIWRRCAEGMVYSGGTCTGTASTFTHEAALQLAATQASSTGITWRLPNIKELSSIADRTLINPAIDPMAFPATPTSVFWSASPFVDNPIYAWVVNFSYGYVSDYFYRYGSYYVRLVRDAP